MIHKHLLICKLPWVSFASLWSVRAYCYPLLVPSSSVFLLYLFFLFSYTEFCLLPNIQGTWMLTSFMPLVKVQNFDSEVSKFRRLNERWHLTMVTYHSQEYSRKCKRHRKYIGTIHMVQNTKALSYHSTVMFPY